MAAQLARWFRAELEKVRGGLQGVPLELADVSWRAGRWTRKQIVGHRMDSAANNRQRFVRAATEGRYAGPIHAQQPWVNAHGYSKISVGVR